MGIDHIPELVDLSITNLRKDGLGEALEKKEIEMIAGDGRKGYPSGGWYSRFLGHPWRLTFVLTGLD